MSIKPSLYFIALIPHKELTNEITAVKNEFAEDYQSKKALNVIPHITLQKPFSRIESFETDFNLLMKDFFYSFPSFDLQLSGYGCFDNKRNKVIFINIVKNEFLFDLQKKLVCFLKDDLNFSEEEISLAFHPHITIGYKDLSAEQFHKAWLIYKSKPFAGSFMADAVYLLKHDGVSWNVLNKFRLGK